jgi:hypothetical protein
VRLRLLVDLLPCLFNKCFGFLFVHGLTSFALYPTDGLYRSETILAHCVGFAFKVGKR